MCGFVGFLNRDGVEASRRIVQSMLDTISHRGPDAEECYASGNLAIGHRRLAIIDLSDSATQPMSTQCGNFVIAYNGEVYNYKEIRSELESEGEVFVTSSDTEVILAAYVRWGPSCVERLNGMFAFVIHDVRSQELFFARDRYGIKPLYYGEFDGVFLFGSEIKAIEKHPSYGFGVDFDGLREYFTFQNFISSKTLNNGVYLFPAGHTGRISLKDRRELSLREYWDFSFEDKTEELTFEECTEELSWLFQRAVKRQLVSDVPVGSYLSGGMDSGSITGIAATQIQNIHTFTCGFDMHNASDLERGFDERLQARAFSASFGTLHHERIIGAEDMERAIPKVAWHLDEPRVGQSYPNFYAAELARSKVKVVLSGAAGDELFAGYPWRYNRAIGSAGKDDYLTRYYKYWQRLVPESDHPSFFSPIWGQASCYSPRETFESVYRNGLNACKTDADYINQSLCFEAKTFLHGLLLVEDKLSMAHSLESRVPMLDNDLVDFAMKIPVAYKLENISGANSSGNSPKSISSNLDGKFVLREAMSKLLPEETAKGKKQGFSGPDASWFQKDSADFVYRKLSSSPIFEFINKQYVEEHLTNKQAKRLDSRLLTWSLLAFHEWLTIRV